MTLKHLRSSAADKRPQASGMAEGQLAINTASGSPGLFFKDSANNLVKVGPVHVGSGAPNVSPASGGTSGNSIGEQWLDTSGGTYVFKIWDGSAWRSEAGEFVNTTGDTMTGALGIVTGSASTPGLFFSGDANSGIYSPGADQVAISTGGSGKIFIAADGKLGVLTASPTTALDVAGGISGTGALNISGGGWGVLPYVANSFVVDSVPGQTRIFATGTDASTHGNLLFFTGTTNGTGAERLRITSDGKLGLGTSSVGAKLQVNQNTDSATAISVVSSSASTSLTSDYASLFLQNTNTTNNNYNAIGFVNDQGAYSSAIYGIYTSHTSGSQSGELAFSTRNAGTFAERMRLTSTGLGIGTTSPGRKLSIADSVAPTLGFYRGSTEDGLISSEAAGFAIQSFNNTPIQFSVVSGSSGFSERARIDSSGRLLVGTSSEAGNALQTIRGSVGSSTGAGLLDLGLGTTRPTAADTYLGVIRFTSTSNTSGNYHYASIAAVSDGTSTSDNDIPGRLVFSTTADGASSPTERMRITSGGDIHTAGRTSASLSTTGCTLEANGAIWAVRSGGTVGVVNRRTDDGNLIEFYQADTLEGAISVSGTTVTYGGGHLARWSQLPNEEDPSDLLKGTVMSNLDEMCEWGEEDNEQLNKTKVSDVEGDPNVAGVFVSTSISDDGPLDFFIAMTGDMIIRIAEGVTVERGDLLMSAGDGTAKPQDDDIIRSKTIAKVTSTNVSCTYDDGSYCVPCVLTAC